jgi:hypothetical protein
MVNTNPEVGDWHITIDEDEKCKFFIWNGYEWHHASDLTMPLFLRNNDENSYDRAMEILSE